MAAASNPWAAVADAVNSLSLADKAIVLVSSSLSAMGALGAARLVSRGPGGYNAQITDLERILKIWEDFLDPRNLTEAYAAQIDATAGPGSVAIMRERLRIVKFAFATLRADVGKASFWQKCSWGNNELQASMTQVNSAIRWADEDFQRTTENTRRAVILSLAREARDAQQPEGQASGSPPPTTSPPPAQDPALATYPPGAHSQPSLQGMPINVDGSAYSAAIRMPSSAAAGAFNQLVRFTIAYMAPFSQRSTRSPHGQHRGQGIV